MGPEAIAISQQGWSIEKLSCKNTSGSELDHASRREDYRDKGTN